MNMLSAVGLPATPDTVSAILVAAEQLCSHLEQGQRIGATHLREAMESAFGASDTTGAWNWKLAYEASEVASVLFLRKYGRALFQQARTNAARLAALDKIASLLPSQTRRSEESQTLQQFSTPLPLGFAALTAAAISRDDIVLEPSAGTGLLAILAHSAGVSLILNELAETRAGLLAQLFPSVPVTRFNAAQIDDHLDPALQPSVVLMNPPFSAMANVSGRMADATLRHVASVLARLAPGGRLVTITGASFAPDSIRWRDSFVRLQQQGRVVFTAAIAGSVYAKHGTSFPTRLTVIDKQPAEDPDVFPALVDSVPDIATLLYWIGQKLPPRLLVELPNRRAAPAHIAKPVATKISRSSQRQVATSTVRDPEATELAYDVVDWLAPEDTRLSDSIYEEYTLQSLRIPDAHRRHHGPQSRLCSAPRALGWRGFSLCNPRRVRGSDRGWWCGGHGSASPRSEGAWSLYCAFPFL